jgi:sn-glycerol 3-phosphate transport system substrate-binding protein
MIRTALAAGALALTGIGAHAQTEIVWWHAMGGALGEAVNKVAESFNADQDEVVVTPIYKGNYEETLTATIAAFRAGEQPNIVQVFDAGAATIIGATGATIPVEDLLNANGHEFSIDEYINGVRYFYADASGKMVGMPFNSSSPILYYNETALEEAGVEPPKTWEEFAETTAPALKEAGYIPLAQSHLPWIFTENFMSRHNQQFATNANGYEGVEGTELLIENEHLMAHFAALKEWYDAELFGYYGAGWADNQQPFEAGEVAMWLGSSASFSGLKQSTDFPFSATFLPYWEGVPGAGTNTFIGGAALFAMSGKPEEENAATAAFFDWLDNPEPQVMWHKDTGYVPITEAAYELAKEQGYYEEEPAAEVGIQQLSLPGGEWTRGYRMGFYVQIRDVMNREYARIFAGETTVEEAFATIKEEGDALLARFAQTQG